MRNIRRFRNPNLMLFDQLLGDEYYGGREPRTYPQFAYPATNITEDGDGYRIYMAVPGLDKKHIKIELENNHITIAYDAEKQDAQEEKKCRYLRREFNPVSFERTFVISDKTVPEKSTASFKEGILTIFIPKIDPSELSTIRTIKVK